MNYFLLPNFTAERRIDTTRLGGRDMVRWMGFLFCPRPLPTPRGVCSPWGVGYSPGAKDSSAPGFAPPLPTAQTCDFRSGPSPPLEWGAPPMSGCIFLSNCEFGRARSSGGWGLGHQTEPQDPILLFDLWELQRSQLDEEEEALS